jgi:hypothetical protein
MNDDGRHHGRTEILDYLYSRYRVTSWRTVRRWKKFSAFPVRYTHTGIPYVLESEVEMWGYEYEQACIDIERIGNNKFLNVRRLSPYMDKN